MTSTLDRLHPVLRDPEHAESYLIAWAITTWFDEQLAQMQSLGRDFFWLKLKWQSADREWLDWVARLHGFDGEFWDSNWSARIKRELIRDARRLFAYRGKPQVFQWLLDLFRLDAVIRTQDGWVLGGTIMDDRFFPDPPEPATDANGTPLPPVIGSTFPIRFGGQPLQYKLIMPARYTESSPEFKLLMRLRRLWLSNAIDLQIVRNAGNQNVNPTLLLIDDDPEFEDA